MRTFSPLIVFALFAAAPAVAADATKKADAPHDAMPINAADQWGEAPPDVPKGASLAVLHGDFSGVG